VTSEVQHLPKPSPAAKSLGGSHPTRSAAVRWGNKPDLFTDGFVAVPHRFLHRYASLNPALSGGEALFVLHLMSFKWDRELPYPSYKTIAQRMGITDKMVRRYAQSLDKKGYLRRQYQVRSANRFDLTGLFEALSRLAANGPPYQLKSETSEEINFA
jgi:Helix-turn-helix domain